MRTKSKKATKLDGASRARSSLKILLSIIWTCCLIGALNATDTSALGYMSRADINFTIKPSVSVSLSSNDLIISELAPDTSKDSNIITVSVSTNSRGGYTLSGSVGNGDSATSYDTTDLVHDNSTGNAGDAADIFSSLDVDASLSSLSTPGTWGYSAATYNATSSTWNGWADYSGLPQYGKDTKILSSKTGPISDAINFKIAALAKPAQAAGEYRNFINFAAVAEPEPDNQYLDINYDANGGHFGNTTAKTTNLVSYNAIASSITTSGETRYSHTPNFEDDGTQSGTFDSYDAYHDVATIDDAERLHVRVTYGTVGDYSAWLSFWEGSHLGEYSARRDYNYGVQYCGDVSSENGKYTTSLSSSITAECDISGDSVTFGFAPSGAWYPPSEYYGYYAVVYTDDTTTTTYSKTSTSGTYATPSSAEEGPVFLGWSTDPNATRATYPSEADVSSNLEAVNGDGPITLYAVWGSGRVKPTGSFDNATYMQDVGTCPGTLTTEQVYELTDSRDGNVYQVAKLADGRCWMLNNLRLGSDYSPIELTPENTNIDEKWELPPHYSYGDSTTDPLIDVSRNSYASDGGLFGAYYNYCAASAGEICDSTSEVDATQDVCPIGWRLPTGSSSGEYSTLYSFYNNALGLGPMSAFQGVYSGWMSLYGGGGGSLYFQNEAGVYWTSTADYGDFMYNFVNAEYGRGLTGSDNSSRANGLSIRCIVDD